MPSGSTERELLVIGRGRAGRALRRSLARTRRFRLATSSGRRPSRRRVEAAGVIVLAVPDPAIAATAAAIAPWLSRGAIVLHLAGSRGLEELAVCRAAGAAIGVMHPLVAMPASPRATLAPGAMLVSAGDRRALGAIRAIARALEARVIVRAIHGPAYHAAAAMLANGADALFARSEAILIALGMPAREARTALSHLLASVACNARSLGGTRALTGPIARGDAPTVARHRAALDPDARAAYDAIAPVILRVAREAGLDRDAARAIEHALAARGARTGERRDAIPTRHVP